ncbi:MAG: hypothetical protein Q7S57_05625 [bacterium]|nr:hypothetical protein [bacterium]
MGLHEQRIENLTREILLVLDELVSKGAGIPRPIIGLSKEMPFFLPVQQRCVAKLRKIAQDNKAEFHPAVIMMTVHPYQDPSSKRVAQVAFPYNELVTGDVIDRLDDESEVKLAKIVMKDVPKDWESERVLDLRMQAISKHVRYGEVMATAKNVNLRVPRVAIPGKESGV